MARPNAYEENIRPNFEKIEQLLRNGNTERQVAKMLGIGYSTWCKYKSEEEGKQEFIELIKKSREDPVDNLISSMYMSGMGFTKVITRMQKCKTIEYDPITGKKAFEKEVMVPYEEEIYIPPNFQAAKYLIQNWGKDLGYCSEPALVSLRERELEHKIEMDKANNW